MPDCPPKTLAERMDDENNLSTRWEYVVGKALKTWVTSVMEKRKITRDEARKIVLDEIKVFSLQD